MSQRPSGYERQPDDLYETPAWVTKALVPHLPETLKLIWEPAAGNGKIVDVLRRHSITVSGTDIATDGFDFLQCAGTSCDGIVTNPPFKLAEKFCAHAIELMHEHQGFVAMLLRIDFDSAKTRRYLFADCPAFAKKLVLTKRIVWFDRPGAAPSYNHAWYIWDWKHRGPPTIAYGPSSGGIAKTASSHDLIAARAAVEAGYLDLSEYIRMVEEHGS